MKFLALATLSLASMVMASPKPGCTPATYACAKNPTTGGQGWQVCDVNRKWIYAGDCPPQTVCKFLPANQSPYCVPPNFQFP